MGLSSIWAFILLLIPLIVIHEFGHYWMARALGVKVLVYSVGFGPDIFKWQSKKTGIIYRFALLPLGGYVKMLDEREAEEKGEKIAEEELSKAFNRQALWKRFLIVFAGPAINLIFAILLFWILLLPSQETLNTRIGKVVESTPASQASLQVGDKVLKIDGKETDTWQKVQLALADRVGESGTVHLEYERNGNLSSAHLPIKDFLDEPHLSGLEILGFLPYQPVIKPIINEVVEGSAAQLQGLKAGDEIVRINGRLVTDWYDVVNIVRKSPEVLLKIDVLRQKEVVSLSVMPQAKYQGDYRYGSLGVSQKIDAIEIPAEYKQTLHYTPVQALVLAGERTYDVSMMILASVGKMIIGLIGLDHLSGPISVAKIAGQTAELGWEAFIGLMALMSVSLAILNLLPIPMLDGGHLAYYIIEAIRGKPVSEKIQIVGFKIGIILLGSLTFLALFNDLMRF